MKIPAPLRLTGAVLWLQLSLAVLPLQSKLCHQFGCTDHTIALDTHLQTLTENTFFTQKLGLQLLFSKQLCVWLSSLRLKTPGNRKPGPENFSEPQNHMCLMEEMPYAAALQKSCFFFGCPSLCTVLCAAGDATTSLGKAQLEKSGTSLVVTRKASD